MTGAIPVFLRRRATTWASSADPAGRIPPGQHPQEDRGQSFAREAVNKNPRILTLTQSTYDGVIYNVEMIKEQLAATSTRCTSTKPGCRTRRSTSSTRTCTPSARTARAAGRDGVRHALHAQAAGRHLAGLADHRAGVRDPQAGPQRVQRGVPDAHVHVAAVRDHRVLRRGRRHDGTARRHRAGRGKHPRSHGLPPRHAQGGIRIRQERLVVQGLGPNRLVSEGIGNRDEWILESNDMARLRRPGRRLQHAGPDQGHDHHPGPGYVRQLRRDRHPGRAGVQVPDRARRGGRRPACIRSSSCSPSASPRAAGTRC